MDKWGFGIKPGEERLAWVKLLLDSTRYGTNGAESTSSMLSRTLNLMPGQSGPTEKQPVDVVADYLRCLRMHTIKTLNRSYGKAFVDATPIDYTLTVPAVSVFYSLDKLKITCADFSTQDLDRCFEGIDSSCRRSSRLRDNNQHSTYV